jgi:hypothetical protein
MFSGAKFRLNLIKLLRGVTCAVYIYLGPMELLSGKNVGIARDEDGIEETVLGQILAVFSRNVRSV